MYIVYMYPVVGNSTFFAVHITHGYTLVMDEDMSIQSMSFHLIHIVIERTKCTCSNELALGCLKAFLHFVHESFHFDL